VSEKYELIDAEKAIYPIVKMCVWLGVARSGFYEWRDRPLSATAERRAEITGLVCAVVAVARKLATLLHRLWVTGERYHALGAPSEEVQAA